MFRRLGRLPRLASVLSLLILVGALAFVGVVVVRGHSFSAASAPTSTETPGTQAASPSATVSPAPTNEAGSPSANGPSDWVPPGQLQLGNIPTTILNADGMAFYTPPDGAAPKVTQAEAEQKARAAALPDPSTGEPPEVLHSYLVEELSKSTIATHGRGSGYLNWFVDLSPPTSGASLSPSYNKSHVEWEWALVNAETGATLVGSAG